MHFTSRNDRSLALLILLFVVTPVPAFASPVGELEGVKPAAVSSDDRAQSDACDFSATEAVIRDRLLSAPGQQRARLECDPRLMKFAHQRAVAMADSQSVTHIVSGVGPNEQLRETGFELPDYYVGGRANSIESILGGEADPDRAWQMFLESRAHREHLLGKADMYRAQSRFGIAHVHDPNTAHRDYWVIVIVEPRDPNQRPMTCTPPPSICIVH